MFLCNSCIAQKLHTYYHKYSPTASDYDIVQWKLSDTTRQNFLLKETVDNKGRVIKLEFLNKALPGSSLCYLADKVIFKYQGRQIIETLYLSDTLMYATDCEMYYKSIYQLDRRNFITRIDRFAKYNLLNLGGSSLKQWKELVPEHIILNSRVTPLQIDYYRYSYAKLNGIYPASKNFELADEHYYGDEPERKLIVTGLRKLRTIQQQ